MGSMPSAHGTRLGTAFSAAKLAILLLVLASTALLLWLAVPVSRDLLLSTLPRLCAAARSYLVPPYIFVVVNFIILVILKLPDAKNPGHRKESTPAAAVVAAASPLKPAKDLPPSSPRRVSSPEEWSAPASSPKARVSSPIGWPDESSLAADLESDPAASPAAAAAQDAVGTGVRPSEEPPSPVAHDDDAGHNSMDAMWKAITGGEPAKRQLKKNETWSTPPRVQLEPAVRRELRKSETFRQAASSPSSPSAAEKTRRAVVQRRVNGREVPVPVPEDHDDINRQFDMFIKKNKDQMRLQSQESAAQRYMEIANSSGYY